MTDNQLQVDDIFDAALRLANGQDRARYLNEVCGGDAELRRRVERLLKAVADAGSFLETPAQDPAPTTDPAPLEQAGARIGPYKLLQEIGQGGMGVVYMAEQMQPIRRKVALKIIKPGMDSQQVIARFEAERQALSLMDHPNIAKVLDAGTTDSGRPYFVMELVKGRPVTQYSDELRLTPRDRLELFLPVCQAIQHAHQKGIIHRDVKPSNVLVAEYDGKPVVKVIDFGVAKAISQALTEKTMFTGFGQLVGTLEYMSPEQARVNQLDIDTRSDIYSLGVLMYELLTGTTPFDKQRLRSAAWDEMLRIIREEEPPKPSTRLSDSKDSLPSISAQRHTEPAKLTKMVRGELDWIVMKALEKDRNRRYETANGFASDIQRFLADEPVQACPPSAGYRLRKFARRNRRGLIITTLLGVVLLAGVGGVAGTLGWAARERAAQKDAATRDRNERNARVASRAELMLADVDRLMREERWPDAMGAARQAEAALAGGEADDTIVHRVRRAIEDLEFVDRLQKIRLDRSHVGGTLDQAGAAAAYALAFRAYGADVEGVPAAEALSQLRPSSPIVAAVVAGLDDWADALWADAHSKSVKLARNANQASANVAAATRMLDPDPARNHVRSLQESEITAQTKQEIRRLAAAASVQDLASVELMSKVMERAELRKELAAFLQRAQQRFPGDFWVNFDLGHVFYELEKFDEAVRYWSVCVAVRPSAPRAYNNLGIALIKQQKVAEAIACFKEAVRLEPHEVDSLINLGNGFQTGNKLEESLAAYREAIRVQPNKANAHFSLGVALEKLGKLNEAVESFREAVGHKPDDVDAYLSLGRTLYAQWKAVEAAAAYREAIRLQPGNAAAHNSLGGILCDALHDYPAAEKAFREAIRLDPNLAFAHHSLGLTLWKKGESDKAIPCFREAVRLKPDYFDSIMCLADLLRMRGYTDEAVLQFRKALRHKPDSWKAHACLGLALQQQEKLAEAVVSFEEAIRLKPDEADSIMFLAEALRIQGKTEQAVVKFREALCLKPDLWITHAGLGLALDQQGKLGEAVVSLHRAIRLNPNIAESHSRLGNVLLKQGKPGEAAASYREASRLKPDDGSCLLALGAAEYRAGNWKSAAEALERFVEFSHGGDGNAWLLLAMTRHRLGQRDQARQWYDKAERWIDEKKMNDSEIRHLRAEAKELLGAQDPKAKSEKK